MCAENVNVAAALIYFYFEVDASEALVTFRLRQTADDQIFAFAMDVDRADAALQTLFSKAY